MLGQTISDTVLLRVDAGGVFDATFAGDGRLELPFVYGYRTILLEDPGGFLLAVGLSLQGGGASTRIDLARVDAAGALDPGFGDVGHAFVVLPGRAGDVALDADRRIVVAGTRDDVAVVTRLTADGVVDPAFHDDGSIDTGETTSGFAAVAIRPDGRILAVGLTLPGLLVACVEP